MKSFLLLLLLLVLLLKFSAIFPYIPTYQHADPDSRHKESVEELMDLGDLVIARYSKAQNFLQIPNSHRHHRHDIVVPCFDPLEKLREFQLIVGVSDRRELEYIFERFGVPIAYLKEHMHAASIENPKP